MTSLTNEIVPISPPARRPGPAATILLIEDDLEVQEATMRLLRRAGYRVLTASTDEQARWVWDHHREDVNLLITDLMLPTRATGIELARQFRQDRPELPVILTSGFGPDIGDDDPDFPRDLPFLQKPYTSEALRRLIDQLLVVRDAD